MILDERIVSNIYKYLGLELERKEVREELE